ncbi:MAG: DUF2314 domain-containing protein [Cyanobacteria bacterium REEB67]|nr:DUF2314 domain-containing protein [Cyanobacteria bacterium REEB67]
MPNLKLGFPAIFAALTLCGTLNGCSKPAGPGGGQQGEMIKPAAAPAGFTRADDSDPELIAAKISAQNGLSEFKAAFAKKETGQKFAVKAPFREGVNEEHKWVIVDAVRKDETDGHIERPSAVIKHLKVGQIITVNDYNIEDWAYTDAKGEQHGGFSVAVLRKREGQSK